MKLLWQLEPAHHAEALLFSAKWTASGGGSKHFGLTQSVYGEDCSHQKCTRHQYEMNQWDGKRNQREHHPQAKDGGCPFDAIGEGKSVEFDMGDGWLGTESSEGTL